MSSNLNLLQVSVSFHASDVPLREVKINPEEKVQINGTSSSLVTDVVMPTPEASPKPQLPHGAGWRYDSTPIATTNPTMLIRGDEAWIFLRRIQYALNPSIAGYIWLNDLVFVSMSLYDFRHPATSSEYSRSQYSQSVVAPDATQDANDSLIQCYSGFMTFGPEDPRIFSFDGKTYVYVVGTDSVSNRTNARTELLSGRPLCEDTSPYGQYLHMAELVQVHPTIVYGPTVPLIKDDMKQIEKAWSMFEYRPTTGNPQLLAVYDVLPHTILLIDPATGNSTTIHTEASQQVDDLAKSHDVDAKEMHGGAGVVFIQDSQQPYYLSCLHYFKYVSQDGERRYYNFAYKFRAEPPFDILRAATKPLPLGLTNLGNTEYDSGIVYISSLAYDNGDVVIGYGSGDAVPRIFRQPLSDFEQEYFPSN